MAGRCHQYVAKAFSVIPKLRENIALLDGRLCEREKKVLLFDGQLCVGSMSLILFIV